MKINESTKTVLLQFAFTNFQVIPTWVRLQSLGKKMKKWHTSKGLSQAEPFIQPTSSCSIADFVGQLEALDFELVDAACEERHNENSPHRKANWIARFTFARVGVEKLAPAFRQIIDRIRGDLLGMCSDALWQVRAYQNPVRDGKGVPIPDQFWISINMVERRPFFGGDGQRVMMCSRDERGRKSSIPLKAAHRLSIVDGEACLVDADAASAPNRILTTETVVTATVAI